MLSLLCESILDHDNEGNWLSLWLVGYDKTGFPLQNPGSLKLWILEPSDKELCSSMEWEDEKKIVLIENTGINSTKNLQALSLSCTCMGESFQDYSWIQDFEADFP